MTTLPSFLLSFAGPGRKRKWLRGGGELREECQITLRLCSEFQLQSPKPGKAGLGGRAGERAVRGGVTRDPGASARSFPLPCVPADPTAMGNTSSERAALERQAGHKTPRRDSSGGAKDGDRPKILMDSPEDADIFHSEEIKVLSRGALEPS